MEKKGCLYIKDFENLMKGSFWPNDYSDSLSEENIQLPKFITEKKSKIITRQYEKQNNLNHSVTIHSGFKCKKIIPIQGEKQLKSRTRDCNYLCVFGHSG